MKLNVIIPCHNEEGNIKILHQKLTETLNDIDYVLIFINDGSKDKTYDKLKEIYEEDKNHVKVINFSRNFGKDAAMYAGLSYAKAKYTAIIDGDCQQNPKYLLEMMKYLEENDDVDQVAMVNKTRNKEKFINKILKGCFYSFINLISDTKFVKGASDFRMFKEHVTKAIVSLNENNRFSKGIFSWVGFNTHYLEYKVENRNSGKSNFNVTNQFKYAFNGIINFSVKPLRIATYIGLISSIGSFIYLIITLIQTLIMGIDVPGYPSLICAILFLGGMQLIAIGILGEYVSKTYLETKKRPVYITKNKLGFNDDDIL
ncbi:MAG: glycosyltransferase family 2 protein [Mollicutes bacterium]|jgi:glycosyltransferase involved in cell wall biosynthesis|nr:glycosyltransferase family 2 protein [Mollicutes bacterium]